ncbi:MAG: hypothetical protein M3Q80_00705 [bacterium]|nr:hypothetical protein [bacterium]
MNTALKKAVMKKAKKEGLTLSDVLNFSARAYIKDVIQVRIVDRDTAEALDDISHGRIISQEALFKKLGL